MHEVLQLFVALYGPGHSDNLDDTLENSRVRKKLGNRVFVCEPVQCCASCRVSNAASPLSRKCSRVVFQKQRKQQCGGVIGVVSVVIRDNFLDIHHQHV